jgi:hypothetical protein
MAKKTTKPMSRHDMAVRLCEGGEVFFQGYWLKSATVPFEVNACDECTMDCICHDAMIDLCSACDDYDRRNHLLYFANEKPPLVADSGDLLTTNNNESN